jgi:hypothetical protein
MSLVWWSRLASAICKLGFASAPLACNLSWRPPWAGNWPTLTAVTWPAPTGVTWEDWRASASTSSSVAPRAREAEEQCYALTPPSAPCGITAGAADLRAAGDALGLPRRCADRSMQSRLRFRTPVGCDLPVIMAKLTLAPLCAGRRQAVMSTPSSLALRSGNLPCPQPFFFPPPAAPTA